MKIQKATLDDRKEALKIAEELKEWAISKANQWGKPVSTLLNDLRLVEAAAPDLVNRVRSGGGGKEGKGVLTRARLKAIVDHLPHEWELQHKLVALVLEQNIIA